ncbi:MAG: phosphoenolpyruvate carboxykinase domain-containing protein, partial [Ktedonobacterales bacterium]
GGKARETPIGYTPTPDGLLLDGLDISQETMEKLLAVNTAEWEHEWEDQRPFFEQFGDHLPREIERQHKALGERLRAAR